jgi:serine/threonine-protein kinase
MHEGFPRDARRTTVRGTLTVVPRTQIKIDVGHVVASKYELVRLIGKGAMGEVWLATHMSLGGEFAIKLVDPTVDAEDATAASRFHFEAQVSAKLSRKTRHIVSVSDHGEDGGLAYLVMEMLDGESLEARLHRAGPLELPELVAVVMQIARALGQAHAEQILHRDLKPANVFLTRDEDARLLVKLLDFGIARTQKPFSTRSPFTTGKDMVLGTPSYMSPEQARGLDSLDHRCDVWALAVLAYEALTGTIPWEGETIEDIFLSICTHRGIPIRERRPDLPPAIQGIFARAFAPKLEHRFGSADELSAAFEAFVEPMAVEAAMGAGRTPSSRQVATAARPSGAGMAAGYREHGTDPSGVAVGHATFKTRKKRSSGWAVAALASVATIGVVALAVAAFTSSGKSVAHGPPSESTPLTSPPNLAPAPEPSPAAAPPPTPPPSPVTQAAKAPADKPAPRRHAGKPPPPSPAAAVVPVATTHGAAPPVPTATARKASEPPKETKEVKDKGEVF